MLRASVLVAACRFLRDDPELQFDFLASVTGVDRLQLPQRSPRFEVVYHLFSVHTKRRVRLKVRVDDGEAVPSLTELWPAANWLEREVFALFGITFAALAFTPASLFAFYLLRILMGALGGGSTPVTWTRAVNAWFVHNRGLALALTLMVTGVTAAFLPSLATWLIEEYGWRKAFVGISLLPLAVALPVVIWLFREPEEKDANSLIAPVSRAGVTVREALRDYRFWVIAASILCVAIGVGGSITNFQPLLMDRGF